MSCRPFLLFPLLLPLLALGQDTFPTPGQSLERMKAPEGFRVRLVAGEPTLIKPIAATTDERGRVWVIESRCYPHWIKDGRQGNDRVLILEPAGDGTWTSRVFLENGTNLSGIAVGFGGVWLASVPQIIHLPVKDDKPAGPPTVHLDGFNLLDTKHNVVNSLIWGPDGWLYGLNGIQSKSLVGPPGAAPDRRVKMDCGVWRYHPIRKKFEAYAHGTTNPWGLDWDDYGEMFITNCVIKHAFHAVPGAHFVRMYGQDVTPHVYGLIESCADHIHWGGGEWTSSRGGKGEHSVAGGGHAHAGAVVYLGDNWPANHRNRLLMGNIHGNRLNQDILHRTPAGYVIKHADDLLFAHDDWFRPLWLMPAHDGGIYVGDWHDTGECHNYDKTHPSGRIYHVAFGSPRRPSEDLSRLSDADLAQLQEHRNEWHVRQSRRLLQERAASGKLDASIPDRLESRFRAVTSVPQKLRLLWAMHVIGSLPESKLVALLDHSDPEVRVWAIRLLADSREATGSTADRLARLATEENHPTVLVALASSLQYLPAITGKRIAENLVTHEKLADHPYFPLMLWYGIEPMVLASGGDTACLGGHFLTRSRIPLVSRHIARRMASTGQAKELGELSRRLREPLALATRRELLRGLSEAVAGQRDMAAPPGWEEVYRMLGGRDSGLRDEIMRLSVLFNLKQALADLNRVVRDRETTSSERSLALETLLDKRAEGVPELLKSLLAEPGMRGAALRGLAHYNDPKTPSLILPLYGSLSESEKTDAVTTLISRPSYALALLDAIAEKKVPRADLTAFQARQLLALKDARVSDRLNAVWGAIRSPAKDRDALLARYKKLATSDEVKKANLSAGRHVWAKTCANCHTLFGEGGKIGPDLTGSQRRNAEYILTKVLDPGAAVPRDYQLSRIVTTTGRVMTGVVKQENEKVLLLQTATEEVRVLKSDIETRDALGGSLMPEGQLATLSDAEIRDLLAYLASEKQVALPGGK